MRTIGLALLSAALFTACTDSGSKDEGIDDTGVSEGSEFHPNVPEGYEYRWDTDGCGDDNRATQTYILGEASSDADGNIVMTERRYTFRGGDWEDDCIDELQYDGTPLSRGELNSLEASEAEEGYETTRSVLRNDCSLRYEDDAYVLFAFDTLTPSGNQNFEEAMLVFRWRESRQGGLRPDYDYAVGVFLPDTEALAPPAHYTWEGSECDD